jgi:DNA-binding response OmpR family regulator
MPNLNDHFTDNSAADGRYRLLIVDDDQKLCRLLRGYLEPMGYEIDTAFTGPEGLDKGIKGGYHAIILDVMLPGMDGFEVLKRLRQQTQTPVLMLTARGEEQDRIVGLEIGADDYLPKTFSTRELLARLRAVIRRANGPGSDSKAAEPEIKAGELLMIPSARTAALAGQPLVLTPVEYDLLASLARAKGRVKTREQLMDEIAGRDYGAYDRSIDVHISALRKKLGDDSKTPRFIKTIRAIGYMMADPNRLPLE